MLYTYNITVPHGTTSPDGQYIVSVIKAERAGKLTQHCICVAIHIVLNLAPAPFLPVCISISLRKHTMNSKPKQQA
jgi:hypothetical protein